MDAWDGAELRELSRERSAATIRNRKCVVMIMARHLTAEGVTDPCAVTKAQLNRYLLRQYADRKPGGRVALYRAVKGFFDFVAEEHQTASPVAGIPRPKDAVTGQKNKIVNLPRQEACAFPIVVTRSALRPGKRPRLSRLTRGNAQLLPAASSAAAGPGGPADGGRRAFCRSC